MRPCYPFTVIKRGCFALYTPAQSNYIATGTGADPAEARSSGRAICEAPGAACVEIVTACDTYELMPIPINQTIDTLESWGSEHFSFLTLVTAAALIFLCVGLALTVRQLQQLERMLTYRSLAGVDQALGTIERPQNVMPPVTQPVQEPRPRPAIDTKAVKEAFKSNTMRRDEFEL